MLENGRHSRRHNDSGQSLFIIAAGMVFLLGVSALAIDLVSFFVARSEAQRAADGGALAGAKVFITSGCTSASGGCVAGGSQEAPATQKAVDIANQNLVAGQAPSSSTVDVSFSYPTPEEPQITVTVHRDGAHSNALPTFFGKVFGVNTVDVSAKATAEAFNPSGSGIPIGTVCLKPWILPNCDPGHTTVQQGGTNPNCGGDAPFIDPSSGVISNPGNLPAGAMGETIVIKPGSPQQAPAPSQFYPVDLPPSPSQPSICPSSSATGCNGLSGGGGGALYRQNIACCNENPFVCGTVTINFETGNMQGPTREGVRCLIHEGNNGSGQDILVPPASPLSITGGSNNPNPALQGAAGLTSSDSIVSIPLYDGHDLCPGRSCSSGQVTIIGFLQVFVDSVDSTGNVSVTILNIGGCGSSGSNGGNSTSPLGSAIPIRLIQGPG